MQVSCYKRMKQILLHGTGQMDLEDIMLSKINQTLRLRAVYDVPRTKKFLKTNNKE